jgi:hypothetical protein
MLVAGLGFACLEMALMLGILGLGLQTEGAGVLPEEGTGTRMERTVTWKWKEEKMTSS